MHFPNLNEALPQLAQRLLTAPFVGSRNGVTREIMNVEITLDRPLEREILHQERKASLPAQIAETMWVLAGRNDVRWLSHYLPRAADFSDDGKTWRAGYGPRLRHYGAERAADGLGVDQLAAVVALLKEDPDTRRAVISLWDPFVDLAAGKDIACNNWLHFLHREDALHLHVATRSNDFIWGWSGINTFEWSVLLEVVARLAGLEPGTIHYSVSSFHLYDQHFPKAQRIANTEWEFARRGQPAFFTTETLDGLDEQMDYWFAAEYQIRTKYGRVEPRALQAVTDPLLREWLDVLRWWWGGDAVELTGWTKAAAELSPNRPIAQALPAPTADPRDVVIVNSTIQRDGLETFKHYVTELHSEKHAAYGDSWKRRGESVSIMANLARKVDRLGGGETRDETSADTAIDLLCYLAKYHVWLTDQEDGESTLSDSDETANRIIESLRRPLRADFSDNELTGLLKGDFETLLVLVDRKAPTWDKHDRVGKMLDAAFELAYRLWVKDQA